MMVSTIVTVISVNVVRVTVMTVNGRLGAWICAATSASLTLS